MIVSKMRQPLQMFFRDPITIIIYLAVLFTISVKLTLFVLLVLPVAGILIASVHVWRIATEIAG